MRSATVAAIAMAVVLVVSGPAAFAQHGHGGGMGGGGGMGAGGGTSGMGQGGSSQGMGRGSGMDNPGSARGQQGGMSNRPTVEEQLSQNTKLSSKLEGVLPAGTNIPQAASGFKNLGQFVAAAHVSHNLGIPFDQLKAKMTSGKSLGEAIHELRPDVNQKEEARKAEKQSKEDLKNSSAS